MTVLLAERCCESNNFRKLLIVNGEPAGTRTQDPRLKRAMLYQLSYRLTEQRARIVPPTLGLCLEKKSVAYRARERILSGLRRMMVSLRFEPVEIISMGHSERSSRN
jgi:hypothetical protein